MTSLSTPLSRRAFALALATALAAMAVISGPGEATGSEGRWIASWGAPISGGGSTGGPENATVRNIARVTLGGTSVRVRLSNAYSTDAPLNIGAAYVALQKDTIGPEIVAGSSRQITFGGKPGVTIPPETDFIYSDPVEFPVTAQQNVAVSLFLPGASPGANGATYNSSYATADGAGDKATEEDGASFGETLSSTYALTAIDVLTTQGNGAVVGLGSSSFHGTASTRDEYRRVLDLLSVRSNTMIPFGEQKAIVSAGIGGDTLHAAVSERLERDVLTQTGVTGVMIYDINDIGLGMRTAEQIISDYRIVIGKAHALGILAFCPTWPPAAQSLVGKPTQERSKLNAWIMNSGECDDVVDWDAVLRDDKNPDTYRPEYFADGIHPNDAGHAAMADATPTTRWFTATPPTPSVNQELTRCLKGTANAVVGSAGKDLLVGTKGKDVLCGFGGNDRFNGKGGNDIILAGGGNDLARGSSGNDVIRGQKGRDTLVGGKGNDTLKGGKKPDTLRGGPGTDRCGSKAEDKRRQC